MSRGATPSAAHTMTTQAVGPEPSDVFGQGKNSLIAVLAPYLVQFAAVAREEHLTHAAEALGVAQPTLSRTMSRLEARIGVPLFLHVGRGIQLTSQGRRLLERVEQALATLDLAQRELAADADGEHGLVRLVYLKSLGPRMLPALLAAFHTEHPHVRFQLAEASSARMIEMLRAGEADLCIMAPPPDVAEIEYAQLYNQEMRLVVPASHRWAARPQVRLADAYEEDFVAMTDEYGTRQIADALCQAAGFSPRIVFEADATDTVRGLVAAGLGVALLPYEAVPRHGTVELPLTASPRTPAARTLCVAWAAHTIQPAVVTLFRDYLRQQPIGDE